VACRTMDHPNKLSRRCFNMHRPSLPRGVKTSGVVVLGKPEEVDVVVYAIPKAVGESR
jgi:hypothetical protein